MSKKSKVLKRLGIVAFVLFVLLYLAYLEIYRNQIFGWFIAVAFIVALPIVFTRFLKEKQWYYKAVAIVVFGVLMVANGIISSPRERQVKVEVGKNPTYSEIVKVEQGELQGLVNEAGNVEIFAGIPYAKAPVGDLRWKEPQAPEKWDGLKVCTEYAPMAMQKRGNPIYSFGSKIVGFNEIPISLDDNYLEAMSEDCLYLNVWKPKDAKPGDKLPVIFYVHGGSLNSGQSYFYAYNGEALAEQGVVFVNISYRLGVFGYFADPELEEESPNHTTGNYGLLDQIAALQWVNDNIAAFGGDAGNITIAGESAGSSSVNALCVSPLAKGLFRRIVAESSGITPKTPYHTFRTMEAAKKVGSNIKEEFKCASIEELRNIPADKLVNTVYSNNEMTVDGYAITEQPYLTYQKGNNNEEAVLGGYNGNEAYVFLMFNSMPKKANYAKYLEPIAGDYAEELATIWPAEDDKDAKAKYLELVGLAWFGYSHYTWSELMTAENRPAYLYYFTKQNKSLGDWHSGEIAYMYGNLPKNGNFNETDFALSNTMQQYLLNFAKNGDPNGTGLPKWETYNSDASQVLHLDESVQMEKNEYTEVFKLFDKYMNSL